ncbi:polyketide cyclase [Tupanvirus deep ocean]|uniref:Polyketide cyclase n=2 Tax=Tupanvirus TaxID=2094720 RepID=A0AC62A8G9_9VIRU|nr:polyketide cyclase [Tupanvirus deep ocean]QKU34072.1 polyketide cyclase [Tupanvirus deep ocean]
MNWQYKYNKYKTKYLELKKQTSGNSNNSYMIGGNNIEDYGEGNDQVKKHLALYWRLNFEGANKQNFDIVREIYHPNVMMRMANGVAIIGIDKNIEMMKQMYDMAEDTKVIKHGIQFGSGDWTAIEQILTGTFTGSMKGTDGKIYEPTGRKFKMKACSFAKWKDNRIIEETIFWDNGDFAQQLGVDMCAVLNDINKNSLCTKLGYVTFGRANEFDNNVRQHIISLENFNYNGYNTRNWSMIYELYDPNVKFTMGNVKFTGIDNIIKQMTNGIKDEKVLVLPIHFGSGNWTAVSFLMGSVGEDQWGMEHCALVKWSNGKIVEVNAFWDNAEAMLQLNNLQCLVQKN